MEAPVPVDVKAPVPKAPVPAPITGVKTVMAEEAPTHTAAGTAVAVNTGNAVVVTTTFAVVEQRPPEAVTV